MHVLNALFIYGNNIIDRFSMVFLEPAASGGTLPFAVGSLLISRSSIQHIDSKEFSMETVTAPEIQDIEFSATAKQWLSQPKKILIRRPMVGRRLRQDIRRL